MNKTAPIFLAIFGAILLGVLVEEYPQVGGGALLLIVLGMLLTAERKGLLR